LPGEGSDFAAGTEQVLGVVEQAVGQVIRVLRPSRLSMAAVNSAYAAGSPSWAVSGARMRSRSALGMGGRRPSSRAASSWAALAEHLIAACAPVVVSDTPQGREVLAAEPAPRCFDADEIGIRWRRTACTQSVCPVQAAPD
jgi:hypothetical protein